MCYSGSNFNGFVEASSHGFNFYNDLISRTRKQSLTYEWWTIYIIFEITKCVLSNRIYFSINVLLLIHLLCELRSEYCMSHRIWMQLNRTAHGRLTKWTSTVFTKKIVHKRRRHTAIQNTAIFKFCLNFQKSKNCFVIWAIFQAFPLNVESNDSLRMEKISSSQSDLAPPIKEGVGFSP